MSNQERGVLQVGEPTIRLGHGSHGRGTIGVEWSMPSIRYDEATVERLRDAIVKSCADFGVTEVPSIRVPIAEWNAKEETIAKQAAEILALRAALAVHSDDDQHANLLAVDGGIVARFGR